MITGKDIVLVSSIDWGYLWQGPQEIALRLARAGNRVLYVENTGVRTPAWGDARRVADRLRGWSRNLWRGPREVAPNVFVHSPLVLPPFGPRWQTELNRRLFVARIRQVARDLLMRNVQLWTFLPTDTVLSLMRAFAGNLEGRVYYCVADFAQVISDRARLDRSERAIVGDSDVVFTNCQALADRFAPCNPNVHVMPFGVDLAAFPLLDATTPGPRPLADHKRPIIGYVGGLHRHLAIDLLIGLARARPDWTFVFVGSVTTDLGALPSLPNVVMPGQVAHAQLASFMRDFDVCLIPYLCTAYTETVMPTKLNEYLAMGKPVVSSELPALLTTGNFRQVVITAPATVPGFERAIAGALAAPATIASVQGRRAVAERAEWSNRLEEMTTLLQAGQKTRAAR